MQELWNDKCFVFIYLSSSRMQLKAEKMLISCVSYSIQIPVLAFLIFATNARIVSYGAISYKRTCSLNLVCRRISWTRQTSTTSTLGKMTT